MGPWAGRAGRAGLSLSPPQQAYVAERGGLGRAGLGWGGMAVQRYGATAVRPRPSGIRIRQIGRNGAGRGGAEQDGTLLQDLRLELVQGKLLGIDADLPITVIFLHCKRGALFNIDNEDDD